MLPAFSVSFFDTCAQQFVMYILYNVQLLTACFLLDLLNSVPTSACAGLLILYLCPPLPVLLLTSASSPVPTNIFALIFLSLLLVSLS